MRRFWLLIFPLAAGCFAPRGPLPDGIGITAPVPVPVLPDAPPATAVPKPVEKKTAVRDTSDAPLELAEVLKALESNFPLIDAAEQERIITAGLRASAEGAFDTNLRLRGGTRDGTFDNNSLDTGIEQPLPFHGMNTYAGYRFGLGSYPVYQGGLKTAAGGEFRAGFLLPLLRDGPIDRRRVILRQAQIGVAMAEPGILRTRIDAYRAARRAYFNWLAAGEQVTIAEKFVAAAKERESVVRERFRRGAATELDAAQATQAFAERQGRLVLATQRFQQAMIDLSLLYRDAGGAPLLAGPMRLPGEISTFRPKPVDADELPNDVVTALGLRPELVRFRLQKERIALDLKLAENQMRPGLNVGAAVAQDVGPSNIKPPNTGIFALERTAAEAFLTFDLPAQRRDARGRYMTAQGQMHQLLQQEKYSRDAITAEVQSAYTILERDLDRLAKARTEQESAARVVAIARDQYERGLIRLFELNSLEVNALDAQAKVVEILADFYRTQADYLAALGVAAAE